MRICLAMKRNNVNSRQNCGKTAAKQSHKEHVTNNLERALSMASRRVVKIAQELLPPIATGLGARGKPLRGDLLVADQADHHCYVVELAASILDALGACLDCEGRYGVLGAILLANLQSLLGYCRCESI